MDFTVIEPGLLAWLATLSGVPAACCVKVNAPRPQHSGQLLTTQWVSTVGVGADIEAWAYDEAAVDPLTELAPTVHGDRRAVLQVDVEAHDHRPGYDAQHTAQRIVDRCRAPSSRAALDLLNVALSAVGPVRRTDYPFDGRMVARATVELSFNAVSHYEDTAGQTATIESVEIGATVTGSAGTALPDTVDGGGTFS